MLSGQELLSKGITKNEVTLPTIGNKDITPNNSWLEKQQIQSAIESRKQLIEAQRIEKSGVLCHAIWQEDLKLAEVTQLTGNFWNFLGHTKDKRTFLKPEEALFLIEINSLLLTYNEVIVSLQQAYSLLLRDAVSIKKYKVFASLSRLGYKVFQHIGADSIAKNGNIIEENSKTIENTPITDGEKCNIGLKNICSAEVTADVIGKTNVENKAEETCPNTYKDTENGIDMQIDLSQVDEVKKTATVSSIQPPTEHAPKYENIITDDPFTLFCERKLQILKSRQQKSCAGIHKYFESIPDILPNSCISTYIQIEVPKNEYLPKNVSLNETTYLLNVKNFTSRNTKPATNDRTYSASDEVNADHIRRVTSSNPIPELINIRTTPFYRNIQPYQCWPQPSQNAYCFSQGSFLYRIPFASLNQPRLPFYPRTHMPMVPSYFMNPPNFNSNLQHPQPRHHQQQQQQRRQLKQRNNSGRKRKRTKCRKQHLESIQNIAARFRNLVSSGCIQAHSVESLKKLIQTYNSRYKENLQLNDKFELINDDKNIETIEIDDDEAPKAKKIRNSNFQNTYFSKIQKLAEKLKVLGSEGKSSSLHKRALSKLIKTFNKSYNAKIYLNDNYDLLDKTSITLDSSSDSDCIVEEHPVILSGKKLRNPFNILKRLAEKENTSSTPINVHQDENSDKENNISMSKAESSNKDITHFFPKCWLPDLNEFGKPEIVSRNDINDRIIESTKEEYLYEFMKTKTNEFLNWTDAKIDFLQSIEETNETLRKEALKVDKVDIKSLINKDDCTNLASVLNKIRIIKNNNTTSNECSLTVDFDVYNRDVHNFRKSDRPKPHFRIVCLDESTKYPSGKDVATLYSKYNDKVMIVFALVGAEAISYLEINPVELSL